MDDSDEPVQLKGFRTLSSFREKDHRQRPAKEEPKAFKHFVTSKGQQNVKSSGPNTTSVEFHNVDLRQPDSDKSEPDKGKNAHLRKLFYLQDGPYDSKDAQEYLSSDRFEIVWRDLAYEIEISKIKHIAKNLIAGTSDQDEPFVKKRVIFENLNGYARSGEITAIIGPSGAGKTSLLNAICGFETSNHRGAIQLFGGRHKKRMQLSLIPQKDYLIDNLTVYENLWYSSRILNVDKGFDHEANIDRVVKVLNLMKCVHTPCKNVSGGEYKRVSIAQELLRQPDILVLDEPTTGLDSLNCKKLIGTLRDLIEVARRGVISPIAIVMTIHQPDVEIYSMFDHVYCLAPGGRVVFDGHPSDTLDVLKTQGGIDARSEGESQHNDDGTSMINPANLLIAVASKASSFGDSNIDRLDAYQRAQFEKHWKFADLYQQCATSASMESSREKSYHKKAMHKVESQTTVGSDSSCKYLVRDKRLDAKMQHKGLFWYHTWLLTRRSFLGTVKDPLHYIISLWFHFVVAVWMWAVYSKDLGKITGCPQLVRDISILAATDEEVQGKLAIMMDEAKYTYEGVAMLFVATYALSLLATEIASMTFPMSMHILLKELRNGRYNMSAFVLGKTLANLPIEVGFPAISMALIYWWGGMPPSYMSWRMIAISVVNAVVAMILITQGLVIGALFMDNPQAAVFLAIAATMPYLLLSGFLARIKGLPVILQYASFFTPYRYSSDLMTIIRYGYGLCPCEPETEQYLKTAKFRIVDIPDSVNQMLKYYFGNFGPAPDVQNGTDTRVAGISYDLVMNATDQSNALQRFDLEHNEPFEPLARLLSRLFSYGQSFESCQSHRSIVMTLGGLPPDDWAPYLFALMVALFVVWRIILHFVVSYKIGSRM